MHATIQMDFPVYILESALSTVESPDLARCALTNREWCQVCSTLLRPRGEAKEREANQVIINKAKTWIFSPDWLIADNLRLSEATHIFVKNFMVVHDALMKIGSTDKIDKNLIALIFTKPQQKYFNVRGEGAAQVNILTVEQTTSLLIYLRHAYSQDGMYNKDEVAACVFYLMFSYILIPEIFHVISEYHQFFANILVQISMVRRCFRPILPAPYNALFEDLITVAEMMLRDDEEGR